MTFGVYLMRGAWKASHSVLKSENVQNSLCRSIGNISLFNKNVKEKQ